MRGRRPAARNPWTTLFGTVLAVAACAVVARAETDVAGPPAPRTSALKRHPGLIPVATGTPIRAFELSPGPRPFLRRLSFSPGYGWLGAGRLYSFRLGFNPNRWMGYEMSIGHAPGDAVHALFHSLSVQARVPLASRVQPYATAGYGMMLVFPGRLLNADAVTKNSLSIGGGLEIYLRDDVALRGELRHRSVLGRDPALDTTPDGTGARRSGAVYDYREASIGITFYRSLGRQAASSDAGAENPIPGGSTP